MVDYTKPTMRDETWRRWKGGKKLADQLRDFYTNPRVWARLGQAAPMLGPTLPAAAETVRRAAIARSTSTSSRSGFGGFNPAVGALIRSRLSPRSAEEENSPGAARGGGIKSAARQSGAWLR